jgi:cell wall-associated NlpC family hydrolase
MSGLAVGGAAAVGLAPPVADVGLTPDLQPTLSSNAAPEAAVGDAGSEQSDAPAASPETPAEPPAPPAPEPTPPADPQPSTPIEPQPPAPPAPESTPPADPQPTTPEEPAPPGAIDPGTPPPSATTVPPTPPTTPADSTTATPEPAAPTPAHPATPATPATAAARTPSPDPLPEAAPPGLLPAGPATDASGDATAVDPGPALTAPTLGQPVRVEGTASRHPIAQAADRAARRLATHRTAVDRLATLEQELVPVERRVELARDAVPTQLHDRWQDLHDQRLEASIVVTATRLGFEQARHELAGLVAAAENVDSARLEAAWRTADPRRLDVMFAALRQVGDPYIANTAGPDRFDCSGLTLYAWRTAGVSLAHYSFTQRSQVPAADPAALKPGDLVFNLRSTGGHVMMSLGLDNLIVHAPGTGRFVEVSHYHNSTAFGSPLAALPAATTPAEAAPAVSLDSVSAKPGAPAEQSVHGIEGADLAIELGQRYGVDPALLAAEVASSAGLRSELLAELGADAHDRRSVADATVRYLVAAREELGDVVSGLAALHAGAGPASRAELSTPVQQWVDRVVKKADQLHQPAPAASAVLTLPAPSQAVVKVS